MNDANYYKDSQHKYAMEAIRLIAEGNYNEAINSLVRAARDQSVMNVLILKELRDEIESSTESNV